MIEDLTNTYNEIPVYYCRHCLSLNIKGQEDFEYCAKCGSTDIDHCNINYWEKLHQNKYKYNFLREKNYGEDSKH